MLKNKIWLGIILSIILLVFSINGFTAYYKYTEESGENFYVGAGDHADALENANEMRQIIDDLGALLVHDKRNDLYPKDETTGGTIQIPETGLKFGNDPANDDIAAYVAGEMMWQTKAELGLDLTLYYLKTEINTLSKLETIYSKDIIDSTELTAYCETTQDYLKTSENDDTADDLSDNDTDDLAEGSSNKYFPGFTSLFVDYAFTDNSSNWNTAYGWGDWSLEGFLTTITGEDFADLADIPAHPAAATKILETTVDGYAWIDTPSGGDASQLSDLSDVGVTTPTDKYVLVADGDSWESRALTESDISDLGAYLEDITGEVSTDLSDTADLLYETELDDFSELQTQIGDKTLINEEDEITFDIFPITPSAAPDANYEVANKKYVDDNAGVDKTNWVYPQDYATGTGTEGDPWAGDCINDAITACPAGGTVYLRKGYYETSRILPNKSINIIGEGIQKTFIVTTETTLNAMYFEEDDYVTLQGFTLDCSTITADQAAGINIHNCDYTVLRDLEVHDTGKEAINFYECNYGLLENLWLHDDHEHGIHPGSDTPGTNIHNTYRNIYCYDNTLMGFYDRGDISNPGEPCYNVYDNIQAWGNGNDGISITYQKGAHISNCYSEDNGSNGFDFAGLEDSSIVNCIAKYNGYTNDQAGLLIGDGVNVNITNVIVLNNNTGFDIDSCDGIRLTSCQSYDDREVTGTDIAFVDGGEGADTITMTAAKFLYAGFEAGETITVTGAGEAGNNDDFTIVSVVAGTITLATGKLTGEVAGETVTITQYKQVWGAKFNVSNTNISFTNCTFSPNVNGDFLGDATALSSLDVYDGLNSAEGDIAYNNGTNWVRLAKGTAQYVFGMGDSNIPEWDAVTGTGSVVRATSPTLVTPALGTPSALVGTNISGTASSLTAGTASVATAVTITDNEDTAENNPLVFVAGGDLDGGNLGLESDGTSYYTPSTGKITATGFIGALTGNADTVTGFTPASGSLTLAGADAVTLTTTNTTGVTLPTSGTLMANVSEDSTPQLGGNLDSTDKNITGIGRASFTQELDNGSKDANFSIDFDTDNKQKVTLTENEMTLTLDTTTVGVGNYLLKMVNGGLATLTWASESGSVYFPGGTDPSLTASGTDIVTFYFDGTNWYGVGSLDFK